MVDENLVGSVNKDLRSLLAECQAHKENPRLIRVIQNLVKLTNVSGEEEAQPEAQPESAATAEEGEPLTEENCAHAFNPYGRCVKCGKCLHQTVRNGTCLVCDASVAAE